MEKVKSKLTVFFEEPFWVGVYEREYGGKYEVCKVTFGAEPKDYEVYSFFSDNWSRLCFSPSIESTAIDESRKNPKRLQREAHKETQNTGMGTKARQALQLQYEQGKAEHAARSKQQREAEEQRRFEQRQEKRKEKHRGH